MSVILILQNRNVCHEVKRDHEHIYMRKRMSLHAFANTFVRGSERDYTRLQMCLSYNLHLSSTVHTRVIPMASIYLCAKANWVVGGVVADMLLYPVHQLAVSMCIMRKPTNVCGGVNGSVWNLSVAELPLDY